MSSVIGFGQMYSFQAKNFEANFLEANACAVCSISHEWKEDGG